MVNKKKLFFLIISFVLLNCGFIGSVKAEGKLGQMITSVKEKITDIKNKKVETKHVCEVNGILYSNKNPSAMINGKSYFINENVCGGMITDITPYKIVVASNGKKYELRVGESGDVVTKIKKTMIWDNFKFNPFKNFKNKITFKKKYSRGKEEKSGLNLGHKILKHFKSLWKKKYPIANKGNFIKVPKVWKLRSKGELVFNVKPEDNPYGDFEAVVKILEHPSLGAKNINEWVSNEKQYNYRSGNYIEKQGRSSINMVTFRWRKISKGNSTGFQYFAMNKDFVYEINVKTNNRNVPAIKSKFDRIVETIDF